MNTIPGRWWWFAVCIAGAVLLLLCGWLVPIHLRAVDLAVIQQAGEASPSLVDRGLALAAEGQLGAAQLLLQAAQNEHVPGVDRLSLAVGRLAVQGPGSSRIEKLLSNGPADNSGPSRPVTEMVIRLETRDRVLEFLQAAASPTARELLRCRALTNTVLFPPSSSTAGQAFDAALTVCGLLLEEDSLAPGLREAVVDRMATAQRGGNTEPLEEVLMDMMSLGQRLSWSQLADFVHPIEDPGALSFLAAQARNAGAQMPVLFAAVELSQKPAAVAAYLGAFSQHGLSDLGTSLRFGPGALEELLRRNQPIFASKLRARATAFAPAGFFFRAATDYALRVPWFALTIKWFFYLSGGFLIAAALHVARSVPVIEEPLQVRGFHVFREILFALGFLLVVLLLSEPFLAQDSQKVEFPLRLRLPGVGSAAAIATPGARLKLMNTPSLLTLLLFFVLQALIYTACLVKLAEIRRQKVSSRIQLKLLENEDHLFDAGLYLGFCGTIVSLILVSLGVIQPSLMAAYSSTSFGIIFVSIFKIFHLRPVRRRLLLQSEADAGALEAAGPVPARSSYATTP
jgi:hypothetical protein